MLNRKFDFITFFDDANINSGNVAPFSGIFEIISLEQFKSFPRDNPEKPRPDLSFVISGKYLLHNVFFDETRVLLLNDAIVYN